MLGYAYEVSEIQQSATLDNRLIGYSFSDLNEEKLMHALSDIAEKTGYAELTPGYMKNYLAAYRLNIHVPCRNCSDSVSKGEIERAAREKFKIFWHICAKLTGF